MKWEVIVEQERSIWGHAPWQNQIYDTFIFEGSKEEVMRKCREIMNKYPHRIVSYVLVEDD